MPRHIDARVERQSRRSHQSEKQFEGIEIWIFGKFDGNDVAPKRLFVRSAFFAAASPFSWL